MKKSHPQVIVKLKTPYINKAVSPNNNAVSPNNNASKQKPRKIILPFFILLLASAIVYTTLKSEIVAIPNLNRDDSKVLLSENKKLKKQLLEIRKKNDRLSGEKERAETRIASLQNKIKVVEGNLQLIKKTSLIPPTSPPNKTNLKIESTTTPSLAIKNPNSNIKTPTTTSKSKVKNSLSVKDLDSIPRLFHRPPVKYPTSLIRRGILVGSAILEVEIRTNGSANLMKIISISHPELRDMAITFASKALFTIPRKNNQPVNVIYQWPLTLKPRNYQSKNRSNFNPSRNRKF